MSEDTAHRIKQLRHEKGLTLEQVANAVGVGKSTVRKWETGMIANIKGDKIASLAKALGTTPAYLMGWDLNESGKDFPKGRTLSEKETTLLDLFNQFSDDKQTLVLQMIRDLIKIAENSR